MQSSLYVALSGQIALENRLATVANNVANANTVGFRAEEISFDAVMAGVAQEGVAFASTGASSISRQAGPLVRTGGALDVAIQGQGWIGIQGPQGTAYTRDGRLQVLDTGELATLDGFRVLDAGGAPLLVDPSAGPLAIARDGMITQGGRQVGAIGLFAITEGSELERAHGVAVMPKAAATPILEFGSNGFVQGYVEQSNVNPVREITTLIQITRAFEGLAAAASDSESTLKNAIQTLGGG